MRPVLQENKLNRKLWFLYGAIFLFCTIGIGVALYLQFYQEEKVELAIGITSKDSEEEDKYNDLKSEFSTLLTNDIEILQDENLSVKKIKQNMDLVVTRLSGEKNEENITINYKIPVININEDYAKKANEEIKQEYYSVAANLMNQISSINVIYSVDYKAYVQNNILSLVIRSEFKEGDRSQKVGIHTYNFNLIEKREATIDEILSFKNITKEAAESKIREEIKTIQEGQQALIDEGYPLYSRNYNSEIYELANTTEFLYGKNGMLYVIYPYGNDDDTSEMDIVIFK